MFSSKTICLFFLAGLLASVTALPGNSETKYNPYDGAAPVEQYDAGKAPTYDGKAPTYDGKAPSYDGKAPAEYNGADKNAGYGAPAPAPEYDAGKAPAGDNYGADKAPAGDKYAGYGAPAPAPAPEYETGKAPAGDNYGADKAPAGDNYGADKAPAGDDYGAEKPTYGDNYDAGKEPYGDEEESEEYCEADDYSDSAPAPKGGSCSTNGQMKCRGQGFDTCDHSAWVYRACGPGTWCREWNGTLFCDHERNRNAPRCSTEGQMRCNRNGSKFDTCDHGVWVVRDCPTGQSCRSVGGAIQCGL